MPINVERGGTAEILIREFFYEAGTEALYRYQYGPLDKSVEIGEGDD